MHAKIQGLGKWREKDRKESKKREKKKKQKEVVYDFWSIKVTGVTIHVLVVVVVVVVQYDCTGHLRRGYYKLVLRIVVYNAVHNECSTCSRSTCSCSDDDRKKKLFLLLIHLLLL